MDLARFIPQNLNFKLGELSFSPTFYQAGAIVVLLFLLVLSLASLRRHLIGWSLRGALFGLFFGFLLALIFEGFLIIGGRTAVTGILGWKDAPKPVLTALDAGRTKLVQVLGVTQEIPESVAQEKSNPEKVLESFQTLTPDEARRVRTQICEP